MATLAAKFTVLQSAPRINVRGRFDRLLAQSSKRPRLPAPYGLGGSERSELRSGSELVVSGSELGGSELGSELGGSELATFRNVSSSVLPFSLC